MTQLDRLFLSPTRIIVLIAAYFIVVVAVRVWLFPGVAEDDAEQFYYAQSWALGYKGSQPPLFTWLVKSAESIIGVGVGALFAVKYATLFGFYVFYYLTARLIIEDKMLVAFAAFSPVAFYYIGWDSVVNYSNSLMLATSLAATIFMLFRLRTYGNLGGYAMLGVVIACGLLAKYNFVLSLLPLLIAGLCHPVIRQKLASQKIIVTVIVVVILVIPHGYWAITDIEGLTTVFDASARPWQAADNWAFGAASGLGKLIVGMIAFVMPAGAFLALCFARPLIHSRRHTNTTIRFFEIYFLCYALIMVVLVLLTQATDVQNHWLMGMLPFPLYVFARLDQSVMDIGLRARQSYLILLCVSSIAVIGVLGGRALLAPETCRKCNFFLPWADISNEITSAGFRNGTIVTFDYPNQISGNLRRYFPNSRVMSARFSPLKSPPAKTPAQEPGSCLIIWNPKIEPAGYERRRAVEYANKFLGTSIPISGSGESITVPIHGSDNRTISFHYILEKDGSGDCR